MTSSQWRPGRYHYHSHQDYDDDHHHDYNGGCDEECEYGDNFNNFNAGDDDDVRLGVQ